MAVRFIREATFVLAACVLIAAISPALADFKQQGPKIVPNDEVGWARLGSSISVSGDGNTAVAIGTSDNYGAGAVWIFTRSNGAWTQQVPKLVGTVGGAVAISADGNTIAIGDGSDNLVMGQGAPGAVWVYTRNNGTWMQQGPKLVGTGATGSFGPGVGNSVALSADGNTLIAGGPFDNSFVGAAWIFTRSNGVWTQQAKIIPVVTSEKPQFGWSVSISADGNTAIIGAFNNSQTDAGWVFTRSNGVWSQQSKLVGNTSTSARAGYAVAISADGNTVLVGAPGQAPNGAACVFTRSNGVWSQLGPTINQISGQSGGGAVALSGDGKVVAVGSLATSTLPGGASLFTLNNGAWVQWGTNLVGLGSGGAASQGTAVAFSDDGSTLLSGGSTDPNSAGEGAVWAFLRFGWHDFNADWKADIIWRATGGDAAIWFMNGPQISSTTSLGTIPAAWSIVGTGDFDGDGHDDILWRNTGGDLAIWFMNGGQVVSGVGLGNIPTVWSVAGVGDFDGDGKADILWRNTGGDITIWFMNGGQIASGQMIGNLLTAWSAVAVADFDGNRKADILWRDTQGDVAIWYMNGPQIAATASYGTVPLAWSVAGARDFNGDTNADILWRNANGDATLWFMSGGAASGQSLGNVATNWSVVQTADFNGDGMSDILWRNTSGDLSMWLMNGGQIVSTSQLGNVPNAWAVQNTNAN